MDDITNEALTGLTTSLQSLLPNLGAGGPQIALTVNPLSISFTGLGGFVGINDQPPGEILGRRISATVFISVITQSTDLAGPPDPAVLDSAEAQVRSAFLAADRATLQKTGILRISSGPPPAADTDTTRNLSFAVLYEFLKIPQTAEGVIQQIPITLNLG